MNNLENSKIIGSNVQQGEMNSIRNEVSENYIQLKELKSLVESLTERINSLSEIAIHRKIYRHFSIWVSIIALITSITAICTSLVAFSLDSAAYLGVVVAILSSLVVILIGWQIFNIIDLKGYKEEIGEGIKLKFNYLQKNIEKLKKEKDEINTRFEEMKKSTDELNYRIERLKIDIPKQIKIDKKNKEYIDSETHRNQ